MPVEEAQFYALLSRAFSGAVTRYDMRWKISLSEAWAMILAGGILNGEAFIWPDPELSRSGRAMLHAKALRDKIHAEGIASFLDF